MTLCIIDGKQCQCQPDEGSHCHAACERLKRFEQGLAILYRKHYQDVAHVCDEVIDRSGALLGRVRTIARTE